MLNSTMHKSIISLSSYNYQSGRGFIEPSVVVNSVHVYSPPTDKYLLFKFVKVFFTVKFVVDNPVGYHQKKHSRLDYKIYFIQ